MHDPVDRRSFMLRAGAALVAGAGLARPATAHTAPLPRVRPPRVRPPGRAGLLSDAFVARLPVLMEQASVPGLAISIVQDGVPVWTRGFGARRAGGPDDVAENTVFEAASLSKPVFAYAVLRMRERGLIDLDRPLAEYMPSPILADEPRAAAITARNVLSHTSGLPNWRPRGGPLTLAFPPGERFQYSGEGFVYLQRVVESITGNGFAAFMREELLEPLGMRSSSYIWDAELEPRMTAGHTPRGQPVESNHVRRGRRLLDHARRQERALHTWTYDDAERALRELEPDLPPQPNFILPNAAASLLSTTEDLGRFLARAADGSIQDRLALSTATRREMLSPQVRLNSALAWGLGWGLEAGQDGATYFWQWGDNGPFKAFAIGDAAARWALVVLANGANGLKLAERVVREASGGDRAAFLWV